MFKGYYKDKYYKGDLTDEQAESVLKCRDLGVVEKLKNIIVDVAQEDVDKSIADNAEKLCNGEKVSRYIDVLEFKSGRLTNEQTVGVAFMYYTKTCILGDEVGLGKTVQIAGLYNLLKLTEGGTRMLFLTEKTPVVEIRKKLMRFTGDYLYLIESGEARDVAKYIRYSNEGLLSECSIVGTHALLNNSEFILECAKTPFDLIVVDESWILKNKKNDIYINADAVVSTASRCVFLNASTLEICVEDIYSQLEVLDKGYLPSRKRLQEQFHVMKYEGSKLTTVGYKDTEAFREAIALKYLSRTRKDIKAEYRDNKVSCYSIPLTQVQKKLMSKTSLKRLVCDYPTGVDRHIEFDTNTVSKLDILLKIVGSTEQDGKQMLVYSAYKGCQEGLAVHIESIGKRACIINGDTSLKNRVALLEGYKRGEYDVLVTNIQRGLDLECCDTVIIYSIDPNPQKMVQVEGRMTRGVNVIGKSLILLVNEGYEQKKLSEVIAKRMQASNRLLNDSSSLLNSILRTEVRFESWDKCVKV